jgi:gluconolactonase
MLSRPLPALALHLCLAAVLPAQQPAPEFSGSIERLDPALDDLLAKDAKIELLASGFNWSEGPVWLDDAIVFSDVPENTAFRWKEGMTAAEVFLKPSGNTTGTEGQGSNGLAKDSQGRLILCMHGDRRIGRREADGSFTTLADRWEGKRFNSPNDLVIASDGTIYFTDPPYGLKDKTTREIDFDGIYSLTPDGRVTALVKDIRWPNGITLSPDEKTLYVAVSDRDQPRVMAFDRNGSNPRLIFDATPLKSPQRKGGCDGLKVDPKGNIWTTGPGGVLILSPEGKHLGSILTGQATANCAWGDDGSTLYITADMFLLRVKTQVKQ